MLMGDAINNDGAEGNDSGEAKPSLDEFSRRLDRARKEARKDEPPAKGSASAWGKAMRISSELLAGLLVGCVLGLGLDRWLGTSPWFLLAGIGVGFAAGLLNMQRALRETE